MTRAVPWLVLLGSIAALAAFHGDERLTTFSLVFVSIVLEALPFMLLGSTVSGLVEVFVSPDRLAAVLPRRRAATVLLAAAAGAVFPVCECGIVPVVRRFLRKGVPLSAAVAYLLAGPIVNPVVGVSTAVAYSAGLESPLTVVALRLGGGFVVAVAVGLAVGIAFDRGRALRPDLAVAGDPSCDDTRTGDGGRIVRALRHAADEFLDIGQYLVVGALIAAAAGTFIDRQTFLDLAASPLAAVLVFMALAVLLNLCSEADAFIAASFRGVVPLSAQLAFLVLGPMFDLKLLVMYLGVFRKRFILFLALVVPLGVLVLVLVLGGFLGPWFNSLPGAEIVR